MRVVNGRVFSEGRLVDADVDIEDGRIRALEARSGASPVGEGDVDAAGCTVVPGLIDVHFHGCMGRDFCEGTDEAIHAIAAYEASRGVTSICPTTMTFPEDVLGRVMDAARAFEPAACESQLVGINMEGPFISHFTT